MRQLLTESLLLAFFGCALGLLFAIWGVDLLLALNPGQLPRLQAVHVDSRVLGFAAFITVLTSVIFGLAPALATLRTDVNKSLKDGDRGSTAASGRSRLRNALVVVEISLALVLLAGAGLLMRTFANLQRVSPGFRPENVLTFHTELPDKRYPDNPSFIRFYRNLAAWLQTLPGVRSVRVGSHVLDRLRREPDFESKAVPTVPARRRNRVITMHLPATLRRSANRCSQAAPSP